MAGTSVGDTAVLAAVVAAVVSGTVSVLTVMLEGRRDRVDRQ